MGITLPSGSDRADLLAEHTRLLQEYGPESDQVYEFEMAHLDDAEFLRQAVADKGRLHERRQARWICLWVCLMLAVLILFQLGSVYLILRETLKL
jgi:hypothetical protein